MRTAELNMHYKLGQASVTNSGTFVLLQIRANVPIKLGLHQYQKLEQVLLQIWDSFYKVRQTLLQNRAAITNWRKISYKLGQVLQIRAIPA